MAQRSKEPKRTHRKHFIPLESNPEVFTELIHKLGVSESLYFQDVLSLDDPTLLAFIPRPVYALILVAPPEEMYGKKLAEEQAKVEEYDGFGEDEDVVFFKQTINNACGLYAILHAICNGEARAKIASESLMTNLLKECMPLKPEERALALEASQPLEEAHTSVAIKGQTEAPPAEDDVDFHYIALVKSHRTGHLFQLDGDRKRPYDLGPMPEEEDVLSDSCLGVIRGMIAREQGTNLNFSLMALVSD